MNTKTRLEKMEKNEYEALPGKQRARLVVKNEAEGNRQAVARLITTCPRKRYEMLDKEFTDAMEAYRNIGVMALMLIEKHREALKVVKHTAEAMAAFIGMDIEPGGALDNLEGEQKRRLEKIVEDRRELLEDRINPVMATQRGARLAVFRAEWEAFAECCLEKTGLEVRQILTGNPWGKKTEEGNDFMECFEEMLSEAAEIQDETYLELIEDGKENHWRPQFNEIFEDIK